MAYFCISITPILFGSPDISDGFPLIVHSLKIMYVSSVLLALMICKSLQILIILVVAFGPAICIDGPVAVAPSSGIGGGAG